MSQDDLPKPPFNDVALNAVKRIRQPLLLYGIVQTILLGFLFLCLKTEVAQGLRPLVWTLAITIVVVALSNVRLLSRAANPAAPALVSPPAGDWRYPRSDSNEFHSSVESQLLGAKRIVMAGIGLNILYRENFAQALLDRASNGDCRLELYFADPFSPAVRQRLNEEELGAVRPPVGRSGLLRRLHGLRNEWQRRGRPPGWSVHLFAFYPTFALIIVDDEYLMYPYGHAVIGNFSPVFRFSRKDPAHQHVVQFFESQCAWLKQTSSELCQTLDAREGNVTNPADLVAFAIYFVPSSDSPLYRFGTGVIGYDLRNKDNSPSLEPRDDAVGEARGYGFHLTLVDALFMLTESEAKAAWVEVQGIAAEIGKFELTNLTFKPGYPTAHSAAIVARETTGRLEALHSELVSRIYRQAVASNYSLGRASRLLKDSDLDERERFFIHRYKAPYILTKFQPHFTLLSNYRPDEHSDLIEELASRFGAEVSDRHITVDRLALMALRPSSSRWEIVDEIRL
jgi:hypothetical protein